MDSDRDLILYVDDEEQALKYFRMAFAKEYEVITATSADAAWPLIEQHCENLALIISDQRMPGKSGVELLTAAKEQCPRAVRVLTTAYSDLSSAIAAVNQGEIYAYVTKPWQLDELKVLIKQALQLYSLRCERDALLAEKLGVFQQLLLADFSRLLAMSCAGLSGQLQRPLAAAAAWLKDRRDTFAIHYDNHGDTRDLWPAVLAQSRSGALLACDLGEWLNKARGPSSTLSVGQHLRDAAEKLALPGLTIEQEGDGVLAVDASLLGNGFSKLLELLASQITHPTGKVTVTVSAAQGANYLKLTLGAGHNLSSSPDFAGLCAYLAIYHHGGSIHLSEWSAQGGHVQVQIGTASNDGLDEFLSRLAEGEV